MRIVEHLETLVVGVDPLISFVEFVNGTVLASQTLQHIQSHLFINQLNSTQKVELSVLFLLLGQLFSVEIS